MKRTPMNRTITAFLLTAAISASGLAQGPGSGERFGRGGGSGKSFIPHKQGVIVPYAGKEDEDSFRSNSGNILKLTKEQIRQLEDMRQDMRNALKPFNNQKKELGDALKAERTSESPNPFLVGDIIIRMWEIDEETRGTKRDYLEAFAVFSLSILTGEQLESLEVWQDRQRPPGLRATPTPKQ